MLTSIQLIVLLFWTSVSSADAEKLFHNRDHSDVQGLDFHQAKVITDEYTAEVNEAFTSHCTFHYTVMDYVFVVVSL